MFHIAAVLRLQHSLACLPIALDGCMTLCIYSSSVILSTQKQIAIRVVCAERSFPYRNQHHHYSIAQPVCGHFLSCTVCVLWVRCFSSMPECPRVHDCVTHRTSSCIPVCVVSVCSGRHGALGRADVRRSNRGQMLTCCMRFCADGIMQSASIYSITFLVTFKV